MEALEQCNAQAVPDYVGASPRMDL